MKFKQVTTSFEKIEQERSRIEITKLLAALLADAEPQEAGIICNLSLGLLRPTYLGTRFNIALKSLTRVVATLLQLSEREIASALKKEGDLGSIVAQGATTKPTISRTVQQVYKQLCTIEALSGVGSQEEKMDHLLALLRQLEPRSAKYIIRIVLGTLRLGFSDMTLVDALSWIESGDKSLRTTIEHAYNICADIGLIASTLKAQGLSALEQMSIHVCVPIRPAAAERMPSAQAIFEKLGPCVAQPKLDGFRIQIHIDNTKEKPVVRFFSRHLVDMSQMFPDLVQALVLLPVKTMIAEGEAIAYDTNTGTFLPFQQTVKRKRKHGIEEAISEFPLRVYLFDLLYLNGTSFLEKSHNLRRKKLEELANNLDDNVQVIDEKYIDSTESLETYFAKQMDRGLEGIVVKKPDAPYQPGKRNFNWIKFKRQLEGNLNDTLDCVVLGYYAGSGKRAQFGIGAFLVGVFNKKNDQYETIAKIGTGLSDEAWRELKKHCDRIKVTKQPNNVLCAKELYPDVWTNPEIICLIRADEITRSPLHSAGKTTKELGYALRFPRFMGYRFDKGAKETTSVAEVQTLYANQFAK